VRHFSPADTPTSINKFSPFAPDAGDGHVEAFLDAAVGSSDTSNPGDQKPGLTELRVFQLGKLVERRDFR
jgi:hypothetical protein